jgi:hypothetical protein
MLCKKHKEYKQLREVHEKWAIQIIAKLFLFPFLNLFSSTFSEYGIAGALINK